MRDGHDTLAKSSAHAGYGARRARSAPDLRALGREFGAFARARFAFAPLDWGIAALVLIGALAVDFHELGGASLWFDETYSIGLASQPLHVMWSYIWSREPNMQLYYLLLHAWLTLTAKLGMAPTEALARAPSAVFAALGSVSLYLLGRRYLGQLAGVIAATVYSLSFFALMSAQQARSYSLELLFNIIAWYMLFGALSEENARARRWWWTLYALATTSALYAHLYTFFIVIAQVSALAALVVLPGVWRAQRARATRQRQPGRRRRLDPAALLRRQARQPHQLGAAGDAQRCREHPAL